MFSRNTLKKRSAHISLEQLINRTRIVVIDDNEAEFPFKIIRSYGYAVDYWNDVNDLRRLESGFYDIIILDIGGIGRSLDEENEGVAVLRHIKQFNPLQIVIAYSGQSHDTRRIPFFQLADQYVPKPTNAITWKETLDDLLKTSLAPDQQWKRLTVRLRSQGIAERQIRKLEKAIVDGAKNPTRDRQKIAGEILGAVNNIATIASVTVKIIDLLS